jgi:hypothetical protein
MASDIQITSLTAVGGVGSIALLAEWAAPAIQSSLPYMQLASVVFYVSATNDFNTATVAGESVTGVISIGSLPLSATRYVWARAKDPAGNLGPRYPVVGGVSVTTASTNPGPNSVGPTELQNGAVTEQKIANLAVTNAKISDLSADKITGGTINATIAINGPTITGGLFRTAATGNRIEISGATQLIRVINSGNAEVARLGVGGTGVGAPSFSVSGTGSGQAAIIAASSNTFAAEIRNTGAAGVALNVTTASTSSPTSHALRAEGATTSSQGGRILLGVSAPGGGWAAYAEVGNYGPFTGAHDALLPKGDEVQLGEIVCSTGRVIAKSSVSDALLEVNVSQREKQRGAFGVVSKNDVFDPYGPIAALPELEKDQVPTPIRLWISENYKRLSVNGCGEGLILVCGRGGDIEVGDYICTSSMRGKGQRQNDETGNADDLLRRHTVAQATQSIKFSDPDEVQLVACIYKCG